MCRSGREQLIDRVAEHNPTTSTTTKRPNERGAHATAPGTNVNDDGRHTNRKETNKPLRDLPVALGIEIVSPPQRDKPSRPVNVVVGVRHANDAIGTTKPPRPTTRPRRPSTPNSAPPAPEPIAIPARLNQLGRHSDTASAGLEQAGQTALTDLASQGGQAGRVTQNGQAGQEGRRAGQAGPGGPGGRAARAGAGRAGLGPGGQTRLPPSGWADQAGRRPERGRQV
jgi:hypothetical protein